MPPPKRPPCQVCASTESKYTCAKCRIHYCSVACYKQHREAACSVPSEAHAAAPTPLDATSISASPEQHGQQDREDPPPQSSSSSSAPNANADAALPPPDPPLRPLTSLKWPYVPEESAYPDPLKRDDPKPLQLHQYEAIATSPAVRTALTTHPRLPALLRSLDALRGPAREDALQRALGVSAADVDGDAQAGPAALQEHTEEDVHALRVLAEAVEAAVRGGKGDVLGLDWGD